jgi:hypothetical protein
MCLLTWLGFTGVGFAQTWSENFDDGNGNTRWYADNGVWQIGSPTIGPATNSLGYRTHSGQYCGTTGLTGDYPQNANSRLIRIASFVVPSAGLSPRLRFWHWFLTYNANDYGVVELQVVGTTNWVAISGQHYYNDGSAWTYASLDLSAYAGQNVKLAFHFISDGAYDEYGNPTVDPGWYVDDIALVTGTPVINNPEGWENGIGDWYADNGTWQVGVPTSGPGAAHSGTNCLATILGGNYAENVNSRMISPAFTVPSAGLSPALRFWHWFLTYNANDYGVVELRAVGTTNWIPISQQYNSSGNSWTYTFFDLSAYGGQNVNLAFHFISDGAYDEYGNPTVDPGWYIDDITLLNYVPPPLITNEPTNLIVVVSSPATFTVAATGNPPLAYQWYSNNVAVPGATNTIFTIPSVWTNNNGNTLYVTVTNSGGATTSASATLTVLLLPQGITGTFISPGDTGGVIYSNGVYTISDSGEGTDGSADVCYFVYKTLAGDGQAVAQLQSLQGGDPQLAQAGVMFRESLDPGSKCASLSKDEGGLLVFGRRLTNDAYSAERTFNMTNCNWLRLMRMGNTLVAHCSSNGLNWQYVWFTTVNMSNQVQVGMAVTAHHYGELATATLGNVSIGSLTPLSGTWPLSGSKILLGGEQWTTAEFQRVGGFKFLVGGVVGDFYSIKASANISAPLSSWPSLGTITNSYGVVPFVDPQALTNSHKYYRPDRIGP